MDSYNVLKRIEYLLNGWTHTSATVNPEPVKVCYWVVTSSYDLKPFYDDRCKFENIEKGLQYFRESVESGLQARFYRDNGDGHPLVSTNIILSTDDYDNRKKPIGKSPEPKYEVVSFNNASSFGYPDLSLEGAIDRFVKEMAFGRPAELKRQDTGTVILKSSDFKGVYENKSDGIRPRPWDIVDRVVGELRLAIATYVPFNSAHEAYAVLKEEVDELWDEVKKEKESVRNERTVHSEAIRDELVQVAAMAIRSVLDLFP